VLGELMSRRLDHLDLVAFMAHGGTVLSRAINDVFGEPLITPSSGTIAMLKCLVVRQGRRSWCART